MVPLGQLRVGVPITGVQILAVLGDTPIGVWLVVVASRQIALFHATSVGEEELRHFESHNSGTKDPFIPLNGH